VDIETLTFGYALTEAPRWAPDGGLYFSDIVAGGVRRLDPGGQVDVVIPRRRRVGGIALHADGGIVITGRDVSHVRDGESRTLLRREGVIFNDLCCDEEGRIFVGAVRPDPSHPELSIGETLRIDRNGEVVTLYGEIPIPNGIAFSPDGSRLYHAESAWRRVHELELSSAGHVRARRILVDLSAGQGPDFGFPPSRVTPDGLAVDAEGGIWVALLGGACVQRYTPEGKPDITLRVPALHVTSVAFGGGDLRDAYIVSGDNRDDPARRGSVFRAHSPIAGLPVFPARI